MKKYHGLTTKQIVDKLESEISMIQKQLRDAQGKALREENPNPVVTFDRSVGFEHLPDNAQWTNRFQIKSETSDKLYIIAQNKKNRHWGCSCPGWIFKRKCKHLEAIGLPSHSIPFEPEIEYIR